MPSQPLSKIGVVGGGQLALMLAEAASELGIDVCVQTPDADDPAVRRAVEVVPARLDDGAATRRLAEACGAITFENEWVPLADLAALEDLGIKFVPTLAALAPLVSKRSQRQLLNRLHLPCPLWCGLEAVLPPRSLAPGLGYEAGFGLQQRPLADTSAPYWATDRPGAAALPPGFRFPLMAKACRGGYDGKGTVPIPDQGALETLVGQVLPSDWILEEMVAFEQELALVACRDHSGSVACFPLVQTHQHQQVCDWVLQPAAVSHAVEALARNVAASLLTELDYVGVLAIEFFYGPAGLQVNELAPRTHNSGHVTIEACRCSQFSQQARLVAGLPMGSSEAVVPAALMVNLLGTDPILEPEELEARLAALASLPGAHLHWYDKRHCTPGRKLGHLTLVLQSASAAGRLEERDRMLLRIRQIWPLPAAPQRPAEALQ